MADRKNKKGKRNKKSSGLLRPLILAAGSWIAYSHFAIDHELPLTRAVDAERDIFYSDRSGALSYYHDKGKTGRPLVLLHSINAAGSAYEMAPLFRHFRGSRPVYALELPGFGFSERSDREYSPQLYKQAILDFMTGVVKEKADVVALSLSSEFAALAAHEKPDLFASLTMISPSGFKGSAQGRSSERASDSGFSDRLHKAFSFRLWARALYDLIATKRSIDYFLKQSFEGNVDAGLAEYDYRTAHQPGAHHAPLYFISGKLFTNGIRETAYEKLTMPVLVLYDRDAFVRFDELPGHVARHANWQAVRIEPTLGLPHFEKLDDTAQALDQFWA